MVLYSAEFISLRNKAIPIRLERKYCTVKESDEANFIFTVPSKFMHTSLRLKGSIHAQ